MSNAFKEFVLGMVTAACTMIMWCMVGFGIAYVIDKYPWFVSIPAALAACVGVMGHGMVLFLLSTKQ